MLLLFRFCFFWCFSNLVLHQILSFSTPPPASTPSHAFDRYYTLLSIYTSFHGEHPFPNTCTCFQLSVHVFHPSDAFFNRNTHSHPSVTIPNHSQLFLMVQTHFLNVCTQFILYCSFSTVLAIWHHIHAFSCIPIHLQLFPTTLNCF